RVATGFGRRATAATAGCTRDGRRRRGLDVPAGASTTEMRDACDERHERSQPNRNGWDDFPERVHVPSSSDSTGGPAGIQSITGDVNKKLRLNLSLPALEAFRLLLPNGCEFLWGEETLPAAPDLPFGREDFTQAAHPGPQGWIAVAVEVKRETSQQV